MKFKYIILILALSLGLTGCPKSSSNNVPPPPPITPPVKTPAVYSINDIQVMVAKTCGTCGNTGGSSNSASAVYNQTLNVSDAPSPNSGHASLFDIQAKEAYANAYWYWPHTALTDDNIEFTYEFSLYIPTEAMAVSQAVEFEMQVNRDNNVYNYAYQFDFQAKQVRVFNYTTRVWTVISVPIAEVSPNVWHHVVCRNSFDSVAKTSTLKTLAIDYSIHDVNFKNDATPKSVGNQFTNAFQLDSNKLMTPYKVFVDKMRLTWYAVN